MTSHASSMRHTALAKAGMNDCGALDGSHKCAGQAEIDNDDQE